MLEVSVALAIMGLILLGLQSLVALVGDTTSRVVAEAHEDTVRRNLEASLRSLFLQVETLTDGAAPFQGTPDRVGFVSRCPSSWGWSVLCPVAMWITSEGTTSMVTVQWPGAEQVLYRGEGMAVLDYLLQGGGEGAWVPQWNPSQSPPLAVRLSMGQDMYLFRIGPRG